MSEFADKFEQKVEQSLMEFIVEQGGGMISEYAMICNFIDKDGQRHWAVCHSKDQTVIQTLGLLRFHYIITEQQALTYLSEETE